MYWSLSAGNLLIWQGLSVMPATVAVLGQGWTQWLPGRLPGIRGDCIMGPHFP